MLRAGVVGGEWLGVVGVVSCCFENCASNDQECPACASENHKVLDIIKAQEQGRDLHEQFHRQVCKGRGWGHQVGRC